MATNLRLRPEAEAAVRRHAEESGRSQQDVLREAVDHYLKLQASPTISTDSESMIAERTVAPARSPYRELATDELVELDDGQTTLGLLDREDRV